MQITVKGFLPYTTTNAKLFLKETKKYSKLLFYHHFLLKIIIYCNKSSETQNYISTDVQKKYLTESSIFN